MLRLEKDAWSMVKLLRQATNEYAPRPRPPCARNAVMFLRVPFSTPLPPTMGMHDMEYPPPSLVWWVTKSPAPPVPLFYSKRLCVLCVFIPNQIFLDVPLQEVQRRDPKGLYKQVEEGKIKSFTGVSEDAPYEAPLDAGETKTL